MTDLEGADPLIVAAREIAVRHRLVGLTPEPKKLAVWSELSATRAWLNKARAAASLARPASSSAAEWLLDNDYQVQRAILQIKEDLPPQFYHRLPGLGEGEGRGLPRVYTLAHGLLHASHLQIALNSAVQFVDAYQNEMPLSIAEIWAFPTMLRLACLELLVTGFTRLFPDVAPPFEVGAVTAITAATDDTECVSRAIANLAVISTIQWKEFFDRTSRVEAILRRDPAGVYPHMDFETRDSYRHAIEQLAAHAGLPEWEVAEKLLEHCRPNGAAPTEHVGYWLVSAGRPAFEDAIDSRPLAFESLGRRLLRYPAALYAAALCLSGAAGFAVPALYLALVEATLSSWLLGIVLTALPASILSVTFVNWVVTLIVPPRVLPKLDFKKAIAPDCPTAVALPVLIAQTGDVAPLLRRLENHRLANPDPSLQFVLLSDHADADSAILPGDAAVEQALVDGIKALNTRYGDAGGEGPFHLLHRPRLYNPAQSCWMGWERKRGKLEQFNAFILHGDLSPFNVIAGRTDALRNVRFVVTADADTRLPPGVVNRMVATLAHPLNTARFDPRTGRVAAGYTILQPRVEIAPETGGRSLFTRFYGGDTTIDIYSRAVSDVYQDLLGTGVYVGKGIYEVSSFERSLKGRIPANNLLSHDLFEGLHGRVALASDIIIYEGFPTGYLDYGWRWHRWVRGDWQILPWLFPVVPGRDGKRLHNRLSWFDRLKIFDNLRRSVIQISLVLLLLGGWFVLRGNPWVWTLLAITAPAAYLFTDLVTGVAQGRRRGVLQGVLRRLADHIGRWALAIAFLVSDAAIALNAILVTLWRLRSGDRLLEWTSAAHMSARLAAVDPRRAAWRDMWASPAFAVLVGIGLIAKDSAVLPVAAPLLLLWMIAPEIAIWIARPLRPPLDELNDTDRKFLRIAARRTWLFFETFVRPEDNWLPPDNYQEPPDEEIAHRTSPTNVGMMMLSTLTAWKLGHIGMAEVEMRLRNALDTLDRLERYRGHMLNWYDTRTLFPLEPRYVSTVDSGNLAVSLIVVQEACRDAARSPALAVALWSGLEDVIDLLARALEIDSIDPDGSCRALLTGMREAISASLDDRDHWSARIDALCDQDCPALLNLVQEAIAKADLLPDDAIHEVQVWLERIEHHLHGMRRDIRMLFPWLPLIDKPALDCAELAARIGQMLAANRPLVEMEAACRDARNMAGAFERQLEPSEAMTWTQHLGAALLQGGEALKNLHNQLESVARRAGMLAHGMDFGLLFDESTRLFHIGYNVTTDRIDSHHYDLLASEARLASFFAIAKGDVPPEHWFFLGRPITKKASGLALVSWNGSMFEYLMPNLFLRSDPETLLGQSDRSAVDLQRTYGKAHGIPWGISESSFASMGPDRIYRYHAFGIPDLGLRRGLDRDLVVAPYATALALAARTGMAVRNLREMAVLGLVGRYGYYEAADFTPERIPAGERFAMVRSYMSHHHGMSLAAMGNALCADMFVAWFHADPHIRTIDLLLNERIPWELPPELSRVEIREAAAVPEGAIPHLHAWSPGRADSANVHVIGNGRLASRLTADGGGCLHWQNQALTRPQPIPDAAGLWIYVRDREADRFWSAAPAPVQASATDTHVLFQAHQAEYHRRDHGIAITMAVGVAYGDDLEIRRITIVNESDRPRTLDFTSYAEVVLAPPLDAVRHPVFSKMFVGGELLPGLNGLLFTRRPRDPGERPPVLLHRVIADDAGFKLRGVEADRATFLGRHGNADSPAAMRGDGLSGTVGWTLDPILALQAEIELAAHGRREIAFITIAAGSRETAIEIAERYTTLSALDWALNDATAAVAREMHEIGLSPGQVPEAQALLSRLLQPASAPRVAADPGFFGDRDRGDLWSLGISGDHPVLLLRTGDGQRTTLLRFLLAAQQLWRRRSVPIDLVVTHEGTAGYLEPVRERLLEVLREIGMQDQLGQNGGIHLVGIGHGDADRAQFLQRAAQTVLDEADGPLGDQLAGMDAPRVHSPRFEPVGGTPVSLAPTEPLPRLEGLAFDNGVGGFTPGGENYVIHLEPGNATPAPWANTLANDGFGTIVTEAGLGFSWAVNSGENRVTPWINDPVRDPQTEILYLRDEENARVWTPTPQPAGGSSACRIRHGAGYTIWERASEGLEQALTVFVPIDDPVKIVRFRLRNLRPQPRRITATYYAEWLLGAVHGEPAPLRTADYDAGAHALLASNPWTDEFKERTAFLTSSLPPHSLTTSRSDFLGAAGDPRRPEALSNWDLGGRQHSEAADCCAAFQVHLDIAPGETAEAVFVLGQGDNRSHAQTLARRWQDPAAVEQAWQLCRDDWDRRLGAVTVTTPDPAFDMLVNRWLPYQATSARLRARAGFYQAGGAFGFRDQLQDVLALLHADPDAARRQILSAAAHQFEEGDVLHWWHPPSDRGVRTRCSDDLLWLPYATATYVEATGDTAILAEEVSFLRGPPLGDNESDRYALFEITGHRRALFEHCERALDRAYRLGVHGLPLMGAGDWNDGMNRVGQHGRGESVWLAWFLIATIESFARLCKRLERPELADRWTPRATALADAVEQTAWDGDWYVRAFDDDGRPWGSASDSECRIDSIAQSWAILSGAGRPERIAKALAAAQTHLVRDDDRLARLLSPPFDKTPRDPGYIKAYPPGIRENGGQYTHAAAWLGIALARVGDGDGAMRLFERINPINHARSAEDVGRYRIEPYVLAADIAGATPYVGRGGWSWYTGAAGWTWRWAIEDILGLRLVEGKLHVAPCLPTTWPAFEAMLSRPTGRLHIRVDNPDGLMAGAQDVTVDGKAWGTDAIPFPTDGTTREVRVRICAQVEVARAS
jgi:cyclic beta-1,2-glucan synthetase